MSKMLVLSSLCQGRLGMAGLALCFVFIHPLEAISAVLDVDKNGVVDATDGVLILRRLNGASTLDTGVQLPSGQTNATITENIDAIRFDAVGGTATTSVKPAAAASSPSTVPATTTSIKPTGTSSLTTTSSSTTSSSTTSSSTTSSVSTTSVPVNTPPVAFFSVTPSSGDTATTFNINASGSSDKEDAFGALQFRWDWNNDGVWEKNYSSDASWNLTFPAATTANIKLEVKDTGGLTSTYTKQIKISARVTTTTSSVATTTSSIAPSSCTNFAGNYLVNGTITSNMENYYCDSSETVINEPGVILQTGCAVTFTGDGSVYNGTANSSNTVSVVASSYEEGMLLSENYTFNKTTGKISGTWNWGNGLCTGSVNFTLTKTP